MLKNELLAYILHYKLILSTITNIEKFKGYKRLEREEFLVPVSEGEV